MKNKLIFIILVITMVSSLTAFTAAIESVSVDNVACNQNVVVNGIQQCSAHVSNSKEGARILFAFVDTNEIVGTCYSNSYGLCNVDFEMNRKQGTYAIKAYLMDPVVTSSLESEFRVWGERFIILEMKTYKSAYSMPSTTFNMGDSVYVTFKVYDRLTNKLVSPQSGTFATQVFLKVNNPQNVDFSPLIFAQNDYTFRYKLNRIPAQDVLEGTGNIFVFIQGRCFDDGGEATSSVTIVQ